jgi:lipopolysaccharide transport system permease protein
MEYEIKPAKGLQFNVKELWDFRELIYFFTLRDIKIKYKQTVLGALWAILQPFLLMVIFTVFFASHLDIKSYNLPYPVFVFSGLILWNVFATGISTAGNSMIVNSNIIKKIYFPRLIIPISGILGTLVDFVMTLLMFVIVLFYYLPSFSLGSIALFLPLSLFITLMTTFGFGCLLAALNVKYRDFRYIIPFMIQILLFLTPVIYPVTIIKNETIRTILNLNPISGAIEILRGAINGVPPSLALTGQCMLISLIIFSVGLSYFRKTEYYFADIA